MRSKKQYIFFCLAKLPLLLLYLSFFAVQLFYNFDIASHPANTASISIHNNKQKDSRSTVKKAASTPDKKISFRLNKRYQPQAAITCKPIIIKQVVCYVNSKLHVHYSSGFIPAEFPPAHSLRGPPNVV
jgi:hypothetical protein